MGQIVALTRGGNARPLKSKDHPEPAEDAPESPTDKVIRQCEANPKD
jgi:hypothetical protein